MSVPRVLVVGSGFAGFHALRKLEKHLPPEAAETVLVSPTDYLLYSPLLPEVATGTVSPRNLAVPLRESLPRTRMVLGHVVDVDLEARMVSVRSMEGTRRDERYDRLVLTPGSVTRQFDTPGVAEHAHGLKSLVEATYLRDHLLRQLDLADALKRPEDAAERRARLTVVAVGAGYTGAETVAQVQHLLREVAARWDTVDPDEVRWVLVDVADAVLPELGTTLGTKALGYLRGRGVEVRLSTGVARATDTEVELTDGSVVPTYTLLWGAGVAPSPLVARLGLPTVRGRLVVDTQLQVPGCEHVWAGGDAAAVPDVTKKPGPDGQRPATAMTAQHAQRHGFLLARNVAASLGHGTAKAYKHRDLGLVADFGGTAAVAKLLGLPLTGVPAKVVTKGYHLLALPSMSNRVRVASDWLLRAALPAQVVQLSQVPDREATIARAQSTHVYDEDPAAEPV